MYTLIIADDEPVTRNGMLDVIQQQAPEFEIVGAAADGRQALEMTEQYKPDLLITDICMPFVGGLELIEKLRENSFSTMIIIISGYEFFSYAQSAIRLGVQEYISKPFPPRKLLEALSRAREKLDLQTQYYRNLHQVRLQLQDSLPLLQERFVLSMTQRSLPVSQMQQRAQLAEIDLSASCYLCAAMRIRSVEENAESRQTDLETFIPYTLRSLMTDQIHLYVAMSEYGHFILWVSSHAGTEETCLLVSRALLHLADEMKKYIALSISCGLSNITAAPERMYLACREAEQALEYALTENWNPLVQYADISMVPVSQSLLRQDDRTRIMAQLHSGDPELLPAILRQIQESFSGEHVSFRSVQMDIMELCIRIRQDLPEMSAEEAAVLSESMIALLQSETLEALTGILTRFLQTVLDIYQRAWSSKRSELIGQAVVMIREHLGDPALSVETLASRLYLSPSQFRKLFRMEEDQPVWDYIIRLRMQKAADMLSATDIRIADIATSVGYTNQRYFAISFKKWSGMTPTEYRIGKAQAPDSL